MPISTEHLYIEKDPSKYEGKAVIRGTRIPVTSIVNHYRSGTAILGEKVRRLLQDKALRNDCLRNLVLSLRAERSNLKGFQFYRELLVRG